MAPWNLRIHQNITGQKRGPTKNGGTRILMVWQQRKCVDQLYISEKTTTTRSQCGVEGITTFEKSMWWRRKNYLGKADISRMIVEYCQEGFTLLLCGAMTPKLG